MAAKIDQPVIEVVQPGALTSLQDLGRRGYQAYGIAESGAMDALALTAANRLVNNPDNACALEITLVGPKLRILEPAWLALTGADLSASLDGRPLRPGRNFRARSGQVLGFGRRVFGLRAYLSVAGGFEAPMVLGSRSTYIYAGFGGLDGRPLKKGDLLRAGPIRGPEVEPQELPPDLFPGPESPQSIRVILGPHEDRFTPEGLDNFLSQEYRVTDQSNRMGYRLAGPPITHLDSPIVVSEATPLGAIQVPGQGVPVILLRERGTTGGYTKIGTVITPDLDLIAQIADGGVVTFQAVEVAEAHRLDRERRRALDDRLPENRDDGPPAG